MSLLRKLASNSSLGVLDSAVSSASNFLLSGLALALLDGDDFATIALLQAGHVIALALHRSGMLESLLIRRANKTDQQADTDGSTALTACAVSAGLVSLLVIAVGLAVGSGAILAFGIGMIPLVIADALRFLAFADREPLRALVVDCTWLAVQALLAVLLVIFTDPTSWSIMAIWVVGALAGALLGIRNFSWAPVSAIRSWLSNDSDIRSGLVLDAMAARAAPAIALFVVGAVLTRSEVALVSGPRSVFGPVNVVLAAALSVGLVGASRRTSYEALRRLILQMGTAMSLVVGAVTALFMVLSGWLTENLSGLEPSQLQLRILLTAGALLAVSWSTALGVAHRSQENTSLAARLQLFAGGSLILGSLVGALLAGAVGALAGQLIGRWLGVAGWAIGSRRETLFGGSDVAVA